MVPVKYLSITSFEIPIASNICAPLYEATVDTPILLITFKTPLPSALTRFLTAFSGVIPVILFCRTMSSTVSIARYGFTAAAP